MANLLFDNPGAALLALLDSSASLQSVRCLAGPRGVVPRGEDQDGIVLTGRKTGISAVVVILSNRRARLATPG
jgi:hypothetical protein